MSRRFVFLAVSTLAVLALAVVFAIALLRPGSERAGDSVLIPSRAPVAAWVTDGEVEAVAQFGGKVLAAGTFSRVTSWTGAFVRVDAKTGREHEQTPGIEGGVNALAADGSGGWYAGGDFLLSGNAACANLAHINQRGMIDRRFCPSIEEDVWRVALAGGRLYAALGSRESADELVALDPVTGRALGWRLEAEGGYYANDGIGRDDVAAGFGALASDGDTLYVGGFFDGLAGEFRTHLAAIEGRTGDLLPWSPRLESDGDPFPLPSVGALAVSEGVLYAGGSFVRVDGEPRSSLAAFELAQGNLLTWAPRERPLAGAVEAIAANNSGVAVAAGRLGAGTKVLRFATPLRDQPYWVHPVDFRVDALALDDQGRVVIGGDFTSIARIARSHAAMISRDGVLAAWNPRPSDVVSAVAFDGNDVLLGGEFAGVGGSSRDGLAAFDAPSGALLPWSPSIAEVTYRDSIDASNRVPYALAATDERVYVFGDFARIDGAQRNRLAAFDAGDLSLESWNPDLIRDGVIFGPLLDASAEDVYVGYWFWNSEDVYDRTLRSSLFGVDADGAVQWKTPDSWYFEGNALAHTGDDLWLGGGEAPYLLRVDAETGELSENDFPTLHAYGYDEPWIDSLSTDGDVLYVAGGFSDVGGEPRSGIASFRGDELQAWDPQLEGEYGVDLDAVSVGGSHAYVGGDFDSIAEHARPGLGAITLDTAEPTDWPTSERGLSGVPAVGPDAVVVRAETYRGSNYGAILVFPLYRVEDARRP